jgi:diguanylate cyclase (GGDEF)-like protein/PAS domain S-box-containing protein
VDDSRSGDQIRSIPHEIHDTGANGVLGRNQSATDPGFPGPDQSGALMNHNRFDRHPYGGAHLSRYVSRAQDQRQDTASGLSADPALRPRRSDALMTAVFESSFDAVMVIGRNGRIEVTNSAAAKLFGCPPEALVDCPASELIGDLQYRIEEEAGAPRAAGRYSETQARRFDGSYFPVELALGAIEFEGEPLHVAIVRDITERRRQQDQLTHQALHDALTGLPNRILLNDRLEQAIRRASRGGTPLAIALLVLDLDRFKDVNDTLGHHVGDLLLTELGHRLVGVVRKTDTIARLGGDEFAVVLPAISDLRRARRVSSRMLRAIQEPFQLDGLSIDVGASIGIALFPDHAEEKEALLRCADVAMYEAKTGPNSIALYDSEKDHNSIRHLTLTGELRRAIEGRRLYLDYQPKLDLKTGRVCGAEALARWDHPTLGPIPPDEFIPQAERTGLMSSLTQLTLSTAFQQLAEWCANGLDIHMAINISARSLHDSALPGMLAELLAEWRVDAHLVSLEITESAIMIDPDKALRVVQRIANMGFHLSIDDFGTGYSSLAYLSRLPVRELKIDRSFVSQLIDRREDATIVQSTIDLAHNLGLKVVAEGAESLALLTRLREMGCDLAQGYLIGRPMPAANLRHRLEEERLSALALAAAPGAEHAGRHTN